MKDLRLKYQKEIEQINKQIEDLYDKRLKGESNFEEYETLFNRRKVLENKIKELEINAFRNLL